MGVTFFSFETKEAKDYFVKYFKENVQTAHNIEGFMDYTHLAKEFMKMDDWVIEKAPCPSDIIWENMCMRTSLIDYLIILFQNILLFLFTCIIFNPNLFMEILKFLVSTEREQLWAKNNPWLYLLLTWAKSSILVFFNYVFIPFCVDFFSYYQGFENKSERHRSTLFKQFAFIIVASVFIPITGQETVQAFFEYSLTSDKVL